MARIRYAEGIASTRAAVRTITQASGGPFEERRARFRRRVIAVVAAAATLSWPASAVGANDEAFPHHVETEYCSPDAVPNTCEAEVEIDSTTGAFSAISSVVGAGTAFHVSSWASGELGRRFNHPTGHAVTYRFSVQIDYVHRLREGSAFVGLAVLSEDGKWLARGSASTPGAHTVELTVPAGVTPSVTSFVYFGAGVALDGSAVYIGRRCVQPPLFPYLYRCVDGLPGVRIGAVGMNSARVAGRLLSIEAIAAP